MPKQQILRRLQNNIEESLSLINTLSIYDETSPNTNSINRYLNEIKSLIPKIKQDIITKEIDKLEQTIIDKKLKNNSSLMRRNNKL